MRVMCQVRVSRSKIFSSAMSIMKMYAHNTNDVLEVHYYNESGVGEGPTLEFYTLMSQELQKRSLQMWRDDCQPPGWPLMSQHPVIFLFSRE